MNMKRKYIKTLERAEQLKDTGLRALQDREMKKARELAYLLKREKSVSQTSGITV